MHDDRDLLPPVAALIGLELPPECIPGVRDALAALALHWRVVDPPAETAE